MVFQIFSVDNYLKKNWRVQAALIEYGSKYCSGPTAVVAYHIIISYEYRVVVASSYDDRIDYSVSGGPAPFDGKTIKWRRRENRRPENPSHTA